MERLGPVIATASAPTTREAAQAARLARAAGADRVEVRLDLLAPGEDPSALLSLAAGMPLLVSGHRNRVCEDEVPLLKRAQELGAWVDLPAAEDLPEDLLGLKRESLVLSWHDFEGTPPELGHTLARLKSRGAAAYKLVPTARDLPDALALLRLLEREGGQGDLAAFAMCAPGVPTRALALAWGSCATYASAPGSASAAPGQPGLEDLLATFRPLALRREDPLYALVGWPLTTTRTPSFFNPWLELARLPGRYVPFPCTEPRALLESGLPLRGVAITIPHKEAPLRLTSMVSRLALECGACNTLVPEGLGWLAANTDVYGVRRALRAVPRGAPYLLLGYGGAAAAAAVALRGRGPGAVAGRDPMKTEAFAKTFGLRALRWEASGSTGWDLLVNATPVGRDGEETPYPLDALKGRWVMDMVVRLGGTPLLRAAAARGLEAIPGEAMLVPQAALQFRLWTGRRPP
jgi:3-dehydroquinate dehydratase / shikimate dehydrogenase